MKISERSPLNTLYSYLTKANGLLSKASCPNIGINDNFTVEASQRLHNGGK